MDPNATLNILLDEARRLLSFLDRRSAAVHLDEAETDVVADAAENLASGVLNLHRWIASGGFLPDAWRKEK